MCCTSGRNHEYELFQQTLCTPYPGVSSIRETHEKGGRSSLIIAVESDIEDQTFKYCLQFIYTGTEQQFPYDFNPNPKVGKNARLTTFEQHFNTFEQ